MDLIGSSGDHAENLLAHATDFISKIQQEKSSDWKAVSQYFKNLSEQFDQLEEKSQNELQISVPELNTFEQLLVSVDNESKAQNSTNVSQSNANDDFGFDISIESLQNHMSILNNHIKNELGPTEQSDLFDALFDTCLPDVCANNSYWICNWIIQLLKDGFWGMKYYNISHDNSNSNKMDNNSDNNNNNSKNWQILKQSLSKHNQMNLVCVGYLVKHKYELQNSIEEIIESGKQGKDKQRPAQYGQYNLHQQYYYGGGQYNNYNNNNNSLHDNRKEAKFFKQYLQNYRAKGDTTKYFTSSPVDNDNDNDSKQSDFVCISKNETVAIDDKLKQEHKEHKAKNEDKKDKPGADMSENLKESKKLIKINYELIDILRNMLIEMATVYRITKVVEDLNNNKGTNGMNSQMQQPMGMGYQQYQHQPYQPYQQQLQQQYNQDQYYQQHMYGQQMYVGTVFYLDYNSGKQVDGLNWLLSSIDRYLNLKLIDLSVVINGITLYHLLVQRNFPDQLGIVLKSAQCDWSAFKDNKDKSPRDIANEATTKVVSIVTMLSEYDMKPNHNILTTISSGDFDCFKRILSDENRLKDISIDIVLHRLFESEIENLDQFFGYIVNNDGKNGLNVSDYSIIIAYCAKRSDFKLLTMIIDNVDKSKYNFEKKFQWKTKNDPVLQPVPMMNSTKREAMTILDICIVSQFPINTPTIDTIDTKLIDDKKNDNYKCFEYLATKTKILDSRLCDAQLIYDCYENNKNSFVECLILNKLCKDYSAVLIHCTKYPQTSKLSSLNLLLNSSEGLYSLFTCDSTLEGKIQNILNSKDCNSNGARTQQIRYTPQMRDTGMNCLHWCVNIGMEPLWLQRYTSGSEFCLFNSYDYVYSVLESKLYNIDSINAAFESFKMILECKNISDNDLNTLLNTRMTDDIHIVETCMSNSIVHPKFIDYLWKNNGKFGWKIDFYNTNVLDLACVVGNYHMLKNLLMGKKVKIGKFGFGKSSNDKREDRLPTELLSTDLRSNSHSMNDFSSLRMYKAQRNSDTSKSRNLLRWCVTAIQETIVNYQSTSEYKSPSSYILELSDKEREFLCLGYLRNGGYDDNVVNIDYPDNIATILAKYFDWKSGSGQCFKYLLNFVNDDRETQEDDELQSPRSMMVDDDEKENKYDRYKCQVSLYPHIVYDCTVYGREELIGVLLNACKMCGYNLTTTSGTNIYQIIKSLLHFACYVASSRIVKYLLILFKNEKDFDINSMDDPKGIVDILLNKPSSSSRQAKEIKRKPVRKPPMKGKRRRNKGEKIVLSEAEKDRNVTPLMAVVESDPTKTNQLRVNGSQHGLIFQDWDDSDDDDEFCDRNKEELECFKLLLSHPDIGKSVSQIHNGKTLFLHCVEKGKKHLIRYMFDTSFDSNRNKNGNINGNIKFDFQTKFANKEKETEKEEEEEKEDCLQIALKSCNLEMVWFLLNNIIKYKIFPNDEIKSMCENLLRICVDEKYRTRYSTYDKRGVNVFRETFMYLMNDKRLVTGKSSGDRYVDVNDEVIESCIINKRYNLLRFLLDKKSDSIALTKDEGKLKKRIETFIDKKFGPKPIPPPPPNDNIPFQDW